MSEETNVINNVSGFSKTLAVQVEQIISNNIGTLTATEVGILQLVVIYSTFLGNKVLPKVIQTNPKFIGIFGDMGNLFNANMKLAQSIQGIDNEYNTTMERLRV